MSKLYLKNGHVVDVINRKVEKADVLVEEGKITAVGADCKAAEDGSCEVVDLKGKYVMPGLFNCHVHICMPPDPDVNPNRSDCQITMLALQHLKQFLDSGTTFIRDVGGIHFIDVELRDAARAGKITAPDMQVSGKCICMTGGHGWQLGREADGPDDCRKAAREQLRAGADWIKVMATGGVMTKGVEPGSPQLNEDELRAAIEEAHKVGAKTCTHAQGMTGIKNALRAGVDSIEHGFYMDNWCFDWMKEHNVFYVPTLAAVYWIKKNSVGGGIPEFAVRKVNMTCEDHKKTFQAAYKAGVKIALGTDAGTPYNPHDKTAYEIILMQEAGMDIWDALRAGTINAAELCEVEKQLGSVEVGKRANLAVFAEDPSKKPETLMDCQMTVLGGNVVFRKTK